MRLSKRITCTASCLRSHHGEGWGGNLPHEQLLDWWRVITNHQRKWAKISRKHSLAGFSGIQAQVCEISPQLFWYQRSPQPLLRMVCLAGGQSRFFSFQIYPDCWVPDVSSRPPSLHPGPPPLPKCSSQTSCTVHSANSHHTELEPTQKNTKYVKKKKEGEKKKARLSVFTFLKPQKNDTKWRFLSASVSTEIRFLKENCLWSKSKGYGRLLFVKETQKKNLFENLAFFSAHRCLLLCSCAFICLSFPFAPVPLPPFLTASPVNTVHHHSFHPSVCRKSAIKWCRVRRAL